MGVLTARLCGSGGGFGCPSDCFLVRAGVFIRINMVSVHVSIIYPALACD